jgi:hypothetical protein
MTAPGGQVQGIPEHMREYATKLAVPDIGGPLARKPQPGACGGGLAECASLSAADAKSTEALQLFLTQVKEGFTAYKSIANECAQKYADGEQLSKQEMEAATRYDPKAKMMKPNG